MLTYDLPPTREALDGYLCRLLGEHRDARSFFIGKSVLGKKIPVLTLGEPRGGILLTGATHGSEWLSALVLLRFFDELCSAVEHGDSFCGADVCDAVLKRGISVVPVLNPDGVDIEVLGASGAGQLSRRAERISGGDFSNWQCNARGVDINHNFGAGWPLLQKIEHEAGIFGPAKTRYGGPRPFSEPETRAICGFCATFDIRRLYSFHSQGEEIYWRYGSRTPPQSRAIGELLARASGYSLCEPCAQACHGGLKDWYIEKFARPGFTIEIGRGENPLPISELEPIYSRLSEMLTIMLLV